MKNTVLILVCILSMAATSNAQKTFDITSGGKMYLDRQKCAGTWVSKKDPNQLKLNISFKTAHIKRAHSNYFADYFIINFIRLIENGENIAEKYPKIESNPIIREAAYQRVLLSDPRANVLIYYIFVPLANGDLRVTPIPMEIQFMKPANNYLLSLREDIVLTREK